MCIAHQAALKLHTSLSNSAIGARRFVRIVLLSAVPLERRYSDVLVLRRLGEKKTLGLDPIKKVLRIFNIFLLLITLKHYDSSYAVRNVFQQMVYQL